ncbi:uncharacterized protein LOC131251079 [Magnolia sinica]|uniref:uncharacterized protein LOC131251079 n=1 Tax=Magnolia sinica TaxID=86752 RepID=UPI00265AC5E4|nr:uncharacterized protein LOC131251079 [Magnolia sinica]
MGINAKGIVINIGKVVIFTVRTCFRSVYNHPFVLVIAIISLLLYRFLPSVFGLFISSSPVIVCTAVLLGILLSFGQPNVLKIEEEVEKTSRGMSSLKAEGVDDDLVVKKGGNFAFGADLMRRRGVGEKKNKEAGPVGGGEAVRSTGLHVGEGKGVALVGEKKVVGEGEHHDRGFTAKSGTGEGRPVNDRRKERDYLKTKIDKTSGGIPDTHLVDDGASSDSGSDSSSSPDASITDIAPMIDELDPLLDAEPHKRPTLASRRDSGTASRGSSPSQESSDSSHEAVDNAENQDEEEEEVEEEEEEAQEEDREDGTAAVVKWTEDDEKNLIDVGTSELERNQRLENLIARRIARKTQRAMAERNLIDLDGNDNAPASTPIGNQFSNMQIQVPQVSTRHNPFDLPYNLYEIAGLPPIPGSAPPVLAPRRNPFDIPNSQPDGSGNLEAGNSSQNDFVSIPQRDMFFRRFESFTLGASFPMESRQERQPVFVVERTVLGEASLPTFERQLSEASDSKESSISDTDSASSVVDQEDQEELLEQEPNREVQSASHTKREVNESSEEANSLEIKQDQSDIGIGGVHKIDSNASDSESSSSSSLQSDDEKIFKANPDEGLASLEPIGGDDFSKAPIRAMRLVHEGVEGVDDGPVEEPVYDSSPSAAAKSISTMSGEEDLFYVDKGIDESTSAASDKQIEPGDGIAGKGIPPANEELWVASSSLSVVDRVESRSEGVPGISEADVIQAVLESSSETKPMEIHVMGPKHNADRKMGSPDSQKLDILIKESAGGPSSEGDHKESQRKHSDETNHDIVETKEITESLTASEKNVENKSTVEVIDSNAGGIDEHLNDLEEAKESVGMKEIDEGSRAKSALNQINEGEVEKLVLLESIDEKPMLPDTEMGPAGIELASDLRDGSSGSAPDKQNSESPAKIHSDMQVLEGRSLEDIHSALKQPKPVESDGGPVDNEASEKHIEPHLLT